MCSIHNLKKHYITTKEKVCIRFTFVNEDSICRSFMINATEFKQNDSLNISKVLFHLQSKGYNVQNYEIRLPQFNNIKLDLQKNPLIAFEKLPKKQFFFHLYKKSIPTLPIQDTKKYRQPERYIGQVIQKVKLWRNLSNNKKISLMESAIQVGISKKSLDDYFLLLRQGQILGFQFDKKLSSKMGELRNFIKQNVKLLPNGRLPQYMNNLKCYSLIGDYCQNQYFSSPKKQIKNIFFSQNYQKDYIKKQFPHPMDLDSNCDYFSSILNINEDSD